MAKSNAERQAAYRARRAEAGGGQGDRRINTWVDSKVDFALDRLARHNGLTRRAMLERLILIADDETGRNLTDADFETYVTP